jgi:uncharacterized SAM-binding protein YcdF (DUF218 family)
MKRNKLIKTSGRFFTVLLAVAGVIFLSIILLAFSSRPYYVHHWLATGIENNCYEPEVIVLFGGAGMPSGENMMRVYYAAEAWRQLPHCPIYICLPGDTTEDKGSLAMMAGELILRGVEPDMIRYEPEGKNTRGQAMELAAMNKGQLLNRCLLVITSPSHMRRSILTLKKTGFSFLIPFPAFEVPLEGELRFDDDKLGGDRRFIIPSAGKSLSLRYEMWTQLNYQLICAREFVALGYYWLRGWI